MASKSRAYPPFAHAPASIPDLKLQQGSSTEQPSDISFYVAAAALLYTAPVEHVSRAVVATTLVVRAYPWRRGIHASATQNLTAFIVLYGSWRRRLKSPSPATLLEEGGQTSNVSYYKADRERSNVCNFWRFFQLVLIIAACFGVFRLYEQHARLTMAFEEAALLLGDDTCLSSKELRETVSPVPFVLLRLGSGKSKSRVMKLLHPTLESVEGEMIEAIVDDSRCATPVTVRRHSRAVVSFVDGASIVGRAVGTLGAREHLRFFQPASLCVQLALGNHPCDDN